MWTRHDGRSLLTDWWIALTPSVSIIVAPAADVVVAAGEPVEIWGWACSFRGITTAEISVDGGATYLRAALEPRRGWAWQRFSLMWRPTDRGEVFITARVLEAGGAGQPVDGARNSIHRVRVVVR
jgi:hypothetical protein